MEEESKKDYIHYFLIIIFKQFLFDFFKDTLRKKKKKPFIDCSGLVISHC